MDNYFQLSSEYDYAIVWEAERILNQRIVDGKVQYNVKWIGFDETTWEPEENIFSKKLIFEFEKAKSEIKKAKNDQNYIQTPPTAEKNSSSDADNDVDSNSDDEDLSDSIEINEDNDLDWALEIEKVIGSTNANGTIKYLVKLKDQTDCKVVNAKFAIAQCVDKVIKFYEDRFS